jgi:hypothetical protein
LPPCFTGLPPGALPQRTVGSRCKGCSHLNAAC